MVLARQMLVQLLIAFGVWVGIVVLVSVAGILIMSCTRYVFSTPILGRFASVSGYARTVGLERFSVVFWKCLQVVLVLDLILLLLPFSPLRDTPAYALYSRWLAMGLGGVAVVLALLSAVALANHRDPWEYLPGGPPFALREFARKYPRLRVETRGFGGTTVTVTNGTTSVIFGESELEEAEVTWAEVCDPAEPERMGGPPAYPGSKCRARIETRRRAFPWEVPGYGDKDEKDDERADEEDDENYVPPPDVWTTRYVYGLPRPDTSDVRKYYEAWAKRAGQEADFHHGDLAEVQAEGRKWEISLWRMGSKYTVRYIYVEYNEIHPSTR